MPWDFRLIHVICPDDSVTLIETMHTGCHQGDHIAFYIMTGSNLFVANTYIDVIMTRKATQITSFTVVYSTVYSDADQIKHQSSASLAFVWGIHRGPVNSPHKWPVTRKMFPFDDVIMITRTITYRIIPPRPIHPHNVPRHHIASHRGGIDHSDNEIKKAHCYNLDV